MQSTLHKVVCYLTSTVCFIDFDSFGMFLLFKNEGLCVCVLTSFSAVSRSTTMGATSAGPQTSTFKDFSPLEEQL